MYCSVITAKGSERVELRRFPRRAEAERPGRGGGEGRGREEGGGPLEGGRTEDTLSLALAATWLTFLQRRSVTGLPRGLISLGELRGNGGKKR